jgi:hypothetical protein
MHLNDTSLVVVTHDGIANSSCDQSLVTLTNPPASNTWYVSRWSMSWYRFARASLTFRTVILTYLPWAQWYGTLCVLPNRFNDGAVRLACCLQAHTVGGAT